MPHPGSAGNALKGKRSPGEPPPGEVDPGQGRPRCAKGLSRGSKASKWARRRLTPGLAPPRRTDLAAFFQSATWLARRPRGSRVPAANVLSPGGGVARDRRTTESGRSNPVVPQGLEEVVEREPARKQRPAKVGTALREGKARGKLSGREQHETRLRSAGRVTASGEVGLARLVSSVPRARLKPSKGARTPGTARRRCGNLRPLAGASS